MAACYKANYVPVIIDLGLKNHYFDTIDIIAQIRLRPAHSAKSITLPRFQLGSNGFFSARASPSMKKKSIVSQ